MSWLSDIADRFSGLFGGATSIGPVADAAKYAEMFKTGQAGLTRAAPSFGFKDILELATPLAGTYFDQAQKRSIADMYSQQAMNQIAAEKEMLKEKLAADLEAAKISAGASVASANISAGAAKKNTLANLYSNWAQLAQRTGEAKGQQALATGQSMNEGAVARARVLV